MSPRRPPQIGKGQRELPGPILAAQSVSIADTADLLRLSKLASYGPSAKHKRYPQKFDLAPVRSDGTRCEDFLPNLPMVDASLLLQRGIAAGHVARYAYGCFPPVVYALCGDIWVVARLTISAAGEYHRYPEPNRRNWPARAEVLLRFSAES